MASTTTSRKRKAVTRDVPESPEIESEAEFGDGLLEGILSQSEDSADDDSGDEDETDEEENGVFDDEEALDSDEISSVNSEDETGIQNGGLPKSNGTKAMSEEEEQPNYTVTTDANGGERYVYEEIDPVYDSDDSDAPATTNTIGNIPLSFYESYPHIGYDINGKKIMRPAKGEALDALLDSIDIPKGWTGLTDPATGKPLNLSQDELEILRRIQTNELPEDGYDPYPVCLYLCGWFFHTDTYRRLLNILRGLRKLCL